MPKPKFPQETPLSDKEAKQRLHMMKAYIEDENEKLLEKMFHETEEEFAIEKNSVIQKGVAVVNKEFERKIERVEKETCMHNFSTLEAGYLKYLAAKHDHFTDIVEKAKDKIEATVHTAAYRQMLTNLIVQSLCFLMENNVEAIFREQDKRLGAGLLRKAAKTFRTMSGINCNIKVNEQQSLDPRSLGGVNLVAVPQRRIFVANNMKLRLHHVMEAIQPFIVQQLFSEEKKPKRPTFLNTLRENRPKFRNPLPTPIAPHFYLWPFKKK